MRIWTQIKSLLYGKKKSGLQKYQQMRGEDVNPLLFRGNLGTFFQKDILEIPGFNLKWDMLNEIKL